MCQNSNLWKLLLPQAFSAAKNFIKIIRRNIFGTHLSNHRVNILPFSSLGMTNTIDYFPENRQIIIVNIQLYFNSHLTGRPHTPSYRLVVYCQELRNDF